MKNEYVSKEELETPRSPDALLKWVDNKVSEIAVQEGGKSAIRLGYGYVKQLMEEVRVTALFTSTHFKGVDGVLVHPVINNDSYDAFIESRSRGIASFKYIEVTQAHDGEDEHLRMLHLERVGHVPVFGSIQKTGTKRTGIATVAEGAALSHSEVIGRELKRIKDAVMRKAVNRYQRQTALVVTFEDFAAMFSDEDLETLNDFVRSELLTSLGQFSLFALVGTTGNRYLEYGTLREIKPTFDIACRASSSCKLANKPPKIPPGMLKSSWGCRQSLIVYMLSRGFMG